MSTQSIKSIYATMEDVREALGDISPDETNANLLNEIIKTRTGKKPSNSTIQKYLNTIRAERATSLHQSASPGTIPAIPSDLVSAVWCAAYSAAQVATLTRLEQIASERDALALQVVTLTNDTDSFAETVDALTEKLDAITIVAATASATVEADNLQMAEFVEVAESALTKANSEINQLMLAAQHAAELAIRDAKIKEQAMQSTIDNLIEQVSQLKIILFERKTYLEPVATN